MNEGDFTDDLYGVDKDVQKMVDNWNVADNPIKPPAAWLPHSMQFEDENHNPVEIVGFVGKNDDGDNPILMASDGKVYDSIKAGKALLPERLVEVIRWVGDEQVHAPARQQRQHGERIAEDCFVEYRSPQPGCTDAGRFCGVSRRASEGCLQWSVGSACRYDSESR